MKAWAFAVPVVAALCLSNTSAHAQSEDKEDDKKTANGHMVVIEVPPDGLRTRLPLDPSDHTVLNFATPIKKSVGNPQGAITKQIGNDRIDVWPDGAADTEDDEPLKSVPLGGNFSVELANRTIVFDVYQPDDLSTAVTLALVRPISRELLEARKDLARASNEVTEAQARESEARQAARVAEEDAVVAREVAAAAQKAAARERTVAARAQADVREARAETAKAQAETAQAQAEANAANIRAREAEAEAEKARKREKAAIEEARKARQAKKQTLHRMLVTAARDMMSERVQRQTPVRGTARVTSGRLSANFHYSDWKSGWFLFDANLQLDPGHPFELSRAQAVVSGQALETYVVSPGAHEDPARGVIATIHPGTAKRLAFAVKVPPDLAERPLTLALTENGSQKSPVTFLVPRYDDVAVALMIAVSAEEEQRRRWAKQVVIGPRFSLGGCWLSSGLDNDDNLDATQCWAIGAYAYKGFHDYFTFGVEGLGAWSGDAQFDRDPTDITRSANLFQLMAFADVRFSREKYVPYLRVGAGGLVTRYDDSETDFSSFYALGGGVLYRVGEHLSLGLGGCMIAGGEQPRALQLDLRVGYGWNP